MKKFYVFSALFFIFGFLFFACAPAQTTGENGDAEKSAEAGAPDENKSNDSKEKPLYSGYEFPEANLEGYVFRIYNATTFNDDRWTSIELTSEHETGDPVNDAVYRRNTLIEEKFNIKITEQIEERTVLGDKVSRSVLAGMDEWDAVFVGPVVCAAMAANGIFTNLNSVSTLNLDAPWWDQNARRSFALDGTLMFTATDAHINNCGYMWITFYNKAIIRDLGLDDLYPVVREGKWSLDVMHGYAKAAKSDLNGDGKFTGADRFGITTHAQVILAFTLGMDFNPITLDAGGYPVINPPSERYMAGADKVRELMDRAAGMFIGQEQLAGGGSKIADIPAEFAAPTNVFAAGRALFYPEVLSAFWGLRAMEDDYGMIPIPKYDEAQKDYYSWMGIAAPSAMIPKSNENPERTGLVLDAMSAVSSTVLMDAYYEVTVRRKASRDEESTEMLELMRKNRVFDLASVYNWGELFNGYRDNIYNLKGESLMTIYERLENAAKTAIENTMETFRDANK